MIFCSSLIAFIFMQAIFATRDRTRRHNAIDYICVFGSVFLIWIMIACIIIALFRGMP